MEVHNPNSYIPDGISEKDFKFDRKIFRRLTRNKRSKIFKRLPKKFDHTPNMTPVKNQGRLGSCVAFATAAVKEWQEWQEYLKHDKNEIDNFEFNDLSEQWIYYRAKDIDNIQNEGTTIRAALTVLKKFGVPPERSWVYNPNNRGKPKDSAGEIAKYTRIGSYFRIRNLKELKIALLNTPVPLGVIVLSTFFDTTDGVIRDIGSRHSGKHGAHAICAVGYDDEKKLIKFKNSWSQNWGDNGYGYLTYDYFKKHCLVSWAVKDIEVSHGYLEDIKG